MNGNRGMSQIGQSYIRNLEEIREHCFKDKFGGRRAQRYRYERTQYLLLNLHLDTSIPTKEKIEIFENMFRINTKGIYSPQDYINRLGTSTWNSIRFELLNQEVIIKRKISTPKNLIEKGFIVERVEIIEFEALGEKCYDKVIVYELTEFGKQYLPSMVKRGKDLADSIKKRMATAGV